MQRGPGGLVLHSQDPCRSAVSGLDGSDELQGQAESVVAHATPCIVFISPRLNLPLPFRYPPSERHWHTADLPN